jgi:hypothetical protein
MRQERKKSGCSPGHDRGMTGARQGRRRQRYEWRDASLARCRRARAPGLGAAPLNEKLNPSRKTLLYCLRRGHRALRPRTCSGLSSTLALSLARSHSRVQQGNQRGAHQNRGSRVKVWWNFEMAGPGAAARRAQRARSVPLVTCNSCVRARAPSAWTARRASEARGRAAPPAGASWVAKTGGGRICRLQ